MSNEWATNKRITNGAVREPRRVSENPAGLVIARCRKARFVVYLKRNVGLKLGMEVRNDELVGTNYR